MYRDQQHMTANFVLYMQMSRRYTPGIPRGLIVLLPTDSFSAFVHVSPSSVRVLNLQQTNTKYITGVPCNHFRSELRKGMQF